MKTLESVALMFFITLCVVLFVGKPDLLDALVGWVQSQSVVKCAG